MEDSHGEKNKWREQEDTEGSGISSENITNSLAFTRISIEPCSTHPLTWDSVTTSSSPQQESHACWKIRETTEEKHQALKPESEMMKVIELRGSME